MHRPQIYCGATGNGTVNGGLGPTVRLISLVPPPGAFRMLALNARMYLDHLDGELIHKVVKIIKVYNYDNQGDELMLVAVLNQKGGVGKTTISTNLAAASHLAGRATLVLDLDEQESSLDWFNKRPDTSPLSGLNVVASKVLSPKKLRELTHGYAFVVLDGPARLGHVSQAAAVAADLVVIPFRPGGYDWWAGSNTLDTLDRADEERDRMGRPPVVRLFVVNCMRPNVLEHRHALEAISKLGGAADPVVIGDRVAYAATARAGSSVFEPVDAKPRDENAAKEIKSLFDLVLSHEGATV